MDHLFSESALAGATIPSGREFEKNHDELTRWQFYVQDDEVMTLEEQVQQLSRSDFNDISLDYDSAVDTEHGSGDHWILMAVLDKYGFGQQPTQGC